MIENNDFLEYMLKRRGFGVKWRRWMHKCYCTELFSTILNGSSVEYLRSSRGLRQGDPLSPFLFLLVADGFNDLLTKAF